MNRKILQAGPTTLAVSLPMDFVKRFKLKKGEELYVEELGSNIKISTKNAVNEDSATINISELHPYGTKIIGILYKLGYRRIKVIYDPSAVVYHRGKKVKEIDMIKNTFNHLTGMQIQEVKSGKKENYATSEEKAVLSAEEFDNTFNQLFLHVISQAESFVEVTVSKGSMEEEAYLVETLINQCSDFCTRVLSTTGYKEHKKTAVYFNFVSRLEDIGDRYYSIFTYYHKNKEGIDNETLSALKKIVDLLRESASLHRKFDMKRIVSFGKSVSSLMEKYRGHISSSKPSFYTHEVYAIILEMEDIVESLYGLNYKEFGN